MMLKVLTSKVMYSETLSFNPYHECLGAVFKELDTRDRNSRLKFEFGVGETRHIRRESLGVCLTEGR